MAETSWPVGAWADTTYIGEDGFEASAAGIFWPERDRWSRFLREHKYWEERESKAEREQTVLKIRNWQK